MPPERAGLDEIAHAHEVRLEAVIVGDVEHDASRARVLLQPCERRLVVGDQRLFDQRVLAMLDEVTEQLDLRRVGNAEQRRVERVERNLAQIPKVRLGIAHVDGGRQSRIPRSAGACDLGRRARRR